MYCHILFTAGFKPHANKDIAHHMLLYGCTTPGSQAKVWSVSYVLQIIVMSILIVCLFGVIIICLDVCSAELRPCTPPLIQDILRVGTCCLSEIVVTSIKHSNWSYYPERQPADKPLY